MIPQEKSAPSGFPGPKVALFVALPGLASIAGMLLNGWHSDRTEKRRWHPAIRLACGAAYLLLPFVGKNFLLAMALLILGGGLTFSCHPIFWSMPTPS